MDTALNNNKISIIIELLLYINNKIPGRVLARPGPVQTSKTKPEFLNAYELLLLFVHDHFNRIEHISFLVVISFFTNCLATQ